MSMSVSLSPLSRDWFESLAAFLVAFCTGVATLELSPIVCCESELFKLLERLWREACDSGFTVC